VHHIAELHSQVLKVRMQVRSIDDELAKSAAGSIGEGLTLVIAEPGAERESYGEHLAAAAGVVFHGEIVFPEDALRFAMGGTGVATLQARDASMALRALRQRLDPAQALPGMNLGLLQDVLSKMDKGACRVAVVPVPGSYVATKAETPTQSGILPASFNGADL